MAHELGLETIAEGVESAEQLAILNELGCDLIQGFYFSRALPAVKMEKILKAGRPILQQEVRA